VPLTPWGEKGTASPEEKAINQGSKEFPIPKRKKEKRGGITRPRLEKKRTLLEQKKKDELSLQRMVMKGKQGLFRLRGKREKKKGRKMSPHGERKESAVCKEGHQSEKKKKTRKMH